MTWMLLFLYSPPEERTPANGGDGTVCGHRGSSGGRGGPPSAHSLTVYTAAVVGLQQVAPDKCQCIVCNYCQSP